MRQEASVLEREEKKGTERAVGKAAGDERVLMSGRRVGLADDVSDLLIVLRAEPRTMPND